MTKNSKFAKVATPIESSINVRNLIPQEIIALESKIKHAQRMITDYKMTRFAIAYLDKVDNRFGCYEARNATLAIDEISRSLLHEIKNTKFDESDC